MLSLLSGCGWVLKTKCYACWQLAKNVFSCSVTKSLSHNLAVRFILVPHCSQTDIIVAHRKVFPVIYDLPKITILPGIFFIKSDNF